jgi:prepilin-type N-terminal cleavage/methylation domain-containing protein
MSEIMFSQRGFSLLEVLVATTVVTVGLAALAQLFAISTNANKQARATTRTSVLAIEKMEQLRGLMWGFDASGLPLADPRLAVSPSDALDRNTEGFCDFLNETGHSLGEGTVPPVSAAYVRRWSIEALPADPGNVLVLQVLVTRHFTLEMGDGVNRRRLPGDTRIVTIRTRKVEQE